VAYIRGGGHGRTVELGRASVPRVAAACVKEKRGKRKVGGGG
jgi:UDP:flavonoid glycosyltransferase YjiC (YdhE family)